MIYWILGFSLLILIIYIIYILLMKPGMFAKPVILELRGWDYAHRGLFNNSDMVFENTLEAFSLAVDKGYGIELDIQFTRDKQIVVFHDFSLKRLCGIDKRVDELTYYEIKSLSINDSDSKIPLLKDVLVLVDGRSPLIIEIKSDTESSEICKAASDILDDYKGLFCIESFNPYVVQWYTHNRYDIVCGFLSNNYLKPKKRSNFLKRFVLTNLLVNFLIKPDFIAYDYEDMSNISLNLCKKYYKIPCVGWTIKSQSDYDNAKLFFDILIFEGFIPARK